MRSSITQQNIHPTSPQGNLRGQTITEQVNIFNQEKFAEEVEKVVGEAAKADTIASRTARHISERMDDDPTFYKKFSAMLKETIQAYEEQRISEAEYLQKAREIMNDVLSRQDEGAPDVLQGNDIAHAYYGHTLELLQQKDATLPDPRALAAEIGLAIDKIIRRHLTDQGQPKVDWMKKDNLIGQVQIEIGDYLIDHVRDQQQIPLTLRRHRSAGRTVPGGCQTSVSRMKQTVRYGSQRISFELSFHSRRTLGITVTPTPTVIVRAPEGTSLEKVKEKVIKRAPWILKQLDYFRHFLPKLPPKRYVGGETHLYLGRQYRLKIIASFESTVKLKGRYLEVHTPAPDRAKSLVQAWYRQRARVKLPEVAADCIVRFRKYGVSPSSVQIRSMTHRWGSCTPQGKILLNPTLLKAPAGCIEYVIIHELCHLVHPHHTARFYRLQSQELPHWQKWKDKLEHLLVSE